MTACLGDAAAPRSVRLLGQDAGLFAKPQTAARAAGWHRRIAPPRRGTASAAGCVAGGLEEQIPRPVTPAAGAGWTRDSEGGRRGSTRFAAPGGRPACLRPA